MYTCYLHGWSSHHMMCPNCVTYNTSSTGEGIVTDANSANEELKARIEELEGAIELLGAHAHDCECYCMDHKGIANEALNNKVEDD